jgi:kynureninase
VTPFHLGPFPQAKGFAEALALDRSDPLSGFRERFHLVDADLIYLDGNSLGRLPIAVQPLLEKVVAEEWGEGLIRSWNERWWDLQMVLGDRLAPLMGAATG